MSACGAVFLSILRETIPHRFALQVLHKTLKVTFTAYPTARSPFHWLKVRVATLGVERAQRGEPGPAKEESAAGGGTGAGEAFVVISTQLRHRNT